MINNDDIAFQCLSFLYHPDRSVWFSQVLVEHIQPKDPANGLQYQKTLLGAVLNISCLLKTPGVVEGHGYFLNPSRSSAQETKIQEANIHQVTFLLSVVFFVSPLLSVFYSCQNTNANPLLCSSPLPLCYSS